MALARRVGTRQPELMVVLPVSDVKEKPCPTTNILLDEFLQLVPRMNSLPWGKVGKLSKTPNEDKYVWQFWPHFDYKFPFIVQINGQHKSNGPGSHRVAPLLVQAGPSHCCVKLKDCSKHKFISLGPHEEKPRIVLRSSKLLSGNIGHL